uniref:F5/8 type C domain-containing protein n=1 Tax=Clytia hemisphaerica TaxID=252671 RepID=A0A7M6DN44_9CNID
PWALVGNSVRGGDKPKQFRDFSYNGTGGDIEYKNIDDWITVQYVRIDLPTAACIQMEFYGCPEVCHSFITYPELQETGQNSSSTEFECIKDRTISFQHAVTLTGIKLDFENDTKAELEMECINYVTSSIIKAISKMAKRSTVLWFDKEYICDAINLKTTVCSTFSVIGCSSASMSSLGVQDGKGTLSAVGSSTDTNFKAAYGRLHDFGAKKQRVGRYIPYSGWLSQPLQGSVTPSFTVDLVGNSLIHGIAISGAGNAAHYATLSYTIAYVYNGKTLDYD